jgi:16S rRNA (guanine966-N2)-methyltransferase
VRVIAGRYKGRRLKTPTWDGLRPSSDKLRETLFNILAPRVEGTRVLDGYAGTGAIGIEALSRGAEHVTFIERDRRATALIAENLATCGVEEGDYTIRGGDMVAALEALEAGSYGLIVLDPPYDSPIRGVLDAAARVIAPGGLIVLERATRREPDTPAVLARVRDVTSGDSTLTFFELARPA